MPKATNVNYTTEQVQTMLDTYNPKAKQEERDAQVAKLAADFGKKKRSIIAKLSREGVYVTAERVTKNGEPVEHKKDIVADIAETVGLASNSLVSFTKATKADLQAFALALAKTMPDEKATD